MKYKKITIQVSNNELNALEDILTCEFKDDKEEEKCREKSLKLWQKLVEEFDKKNLVHSHRGKFKGRVNERANGREEAQSMADILSKPIQSIT